MLNRFHTQRAAGFKARWLVALSVSLVSTILGCGESQSKQAARVAKLVEQMSSPDADERYDAIKELEAVPEALSEHLFVIADGLKDESPKVRYRCAKLLDEMDQKAAPAVERLANAMSSDDEKIRYYVAKALDNIGRQADFAQPQLITATADRNTKVRYYAVKALGNIEEESPEVVDALQRCLKDPDEQVVKAATAALKKVKS